MTTFVIESEDAQEIMSYLVEKPYIEVYQVVEKLQGLQEIIVEDPEDPEDPAT